MTIFDKTESALYQIKDLLLDNIQIRKLLYNMTTNALSEAEPSIEDVEQLITIVPYIDDENGVAESYKNSFIVIYPTNFLFNENEVIINISIGSFVTKDYYELNNRKIRGLSLMSEISKTVSYEKLEFAGKMELMNVTSLTIDLGKFIGFTSNWEVVDGKSVNF